MYDQLLQKIDRWHGKLPIGTVFSGADAVAQTIEANEMFSRILGQVFCGELDNREDADRTTDGHNAICALSVLQKHLISTGAVNLGDIRTAIWEGIRPFLMIGGPPCPPYARSNQQNPGRLHFLAWLGPEYARFCGRTLPLVCVMENVASITHSQHKPYFDKIIRIFEDAGYACDWRILDSIDYGYPVMRPRMYLVCVLHGHRDAVNDIFDRIETGRTGFNSYTVDYSRYFESDEAYKQRTGSVAGLRELVITPENARGGLFRADGSDRRSTSLRNDVAEIFARVESGDRPSGETRDRIMPLFWSRERALRSSEYILPTVLKGGRSDMGGFVEIGGKLWPRILTSYEVERFAEFSGTWTDVPHVERMLQDIPDARKCLEEAERFALMGNTMHCGILKNIIHAILKAFDLEA